jgi:hypothetical protein
VPVADRAARVGGQCAPSLKHRHIRPFAEFFRQEPTSQTSPTMAIVGLRLAVIEVLPVLLTRASVIDIGIPCIMAPKSALLVS